MPAPSITPLDPPVRTPDRGITSSGKSGVGLVAQAQSVALRRALPVDAAVSGFDDWASTQSEVAEAFLNGIDSLDTNPAYTALGRGEQAKARVVTRIAEINHMRAATVAGYDRRIADAQRATLKPSAPSTEDPVLRFLRFKELRDRFAMVTDPLDRQMQVDAAARAGNVDLLAALAVPVVPPLIDPEVVAQAQRRMAEGTNPELVRLQALKGAYAAVLGVEEQEARAVLDRYGLSLNSTPATDMK